MATLGQMIRMLGSDQPGDVVAAATAIGKALRKQGKDFHWLADLADRGLPAPQPKTPTATKTPTAADVVRERMREQQEAAEAYRRAREKANQQAQQRQETWWTRYSGSGLLKHQMFARAMLDSYRDRLRAVEIDFLISMAVWTGQPTEKQADWLNELHEKWKIWEARKR